jgi:type VI secretion system secreted protein Hcp
MTADIFIKIDDVKGESVDRSHKDEIEVLTWSWGMNQGGNAHSGTGAGAGKVSLKDISFVKYIDRSSPVLVKLCCSGKHFAVAKLTVRKAGGEAIPYIKLELNDGIISSIAVAGGPVDERLRETITLNFAKYSYEYFPQAKDGSAAAAIPASWNVAKNAPT